MKFVIISFVLALAAQAAGVRPQAPKAPKSSAEYCHTEIYYDYTGCRNIVVCD